MARDTFIERLKQKPDHTKKQIAFGVSSVVMLGILTIWISTFSIRFPGLTLQGPTDVYNANQQQASVGTALEQVRQQLNSPQSISESYDGYTPDGYTSSDGEVTISPSQLEASE